MNRSNDMGNTKDFHQQKKKQALGPLSCLLVIFLRFCKGEKPLQNHKENRTTENKYQWIGIYKVLRFLRDRDVQG